MPSPLPEIGHGRFTRTESADTVLALWKHRFMFDLPLDPRSQLALLCLATALAFWNNDLLFFTFALMAVCTRVGAN